MPIPATSHATGRRRVVVAVGRIGAARQSLRRGGVSEPSDCRPRPRFEDAGPEVYCRGSAFPRGGGDGVRPAAPRRLPAGRRRTAGRSLCRTGALVRLLAYLAPAPSPVPRKKLAELLSAEGDEQDQRTALRQAIYVPARRCRTPPSSAPVKAISASMRRSCTPTCVGSGRPSRAAMIVPWQRPLTSIVARCWPARNRRHRRSRSGCADAGASFSNGLSRPCYCWPARTRRPAVAYSALTHARRALELDPLREDGHRQVMRSSRPSGSGPGAASLRGRAPGAGGGAERGAGGCNRVAAQGDSRVGRTHPDDRGSALPWVGLHSAERARRRISAPLATSRPSRGWHCRLPSCFCSRSEAACGGRRGTAGPRATGRA